MALELFKESNIFLYLYLLHVWYIPQATLLCFFHCHLIFCLINPKMISQYHGVFVFHNDLVFCVLLLLQHSYSHAIEMLFNQEWDK